MLDNLEFIYYNSKASSREQAKQTACTECMTWDLSSAGRASALQAEGHRFEPCRSHILIKYGGIAQLARAHGSYPWCRWFKSSSRYFLLHLIKPDICGLMYGFGQWKRIDTYNLIDERTRSLCKAALYFTQLVLIH